jgi:two-component system, chemotaxis family, sensor kinase CheA
MSIRNQVNGTKDKYLTSLYKILIVDDETELADMIAEFVEKDYESHAVYSPEDAIEFVKLYNKDICMIISDYDMPNKNGMELRRELIDLGYGKIPFMILSGHISREVALSAVDLKICGFCNKPTSVEEIAEIVERESKERISELLISDLADIFMPLQTHRFVELSNELFDELDQLHKKMEAHPNDVSFINVALKLLQKIDEAGIFIEEPQIREYFDIYRDLLLKLKGHKISRTPIVVSMVSKAYNYLRDAIVALEGGGSKSNNSDFKLRTLQVMKENNERIYATDENAVVESISISEMCVVAEELIQDASSHLKKLQSNTDHAADVIIINEIVNEIHEIFVKINQAVADKNVA